MAVGESVVRKEAVDKVTGVAKCSADFVAPGILRARIVASSQAHARPLAVDADAARAMADVGAIVTGADADILCGGVLADRPPLARGRVRYHGEPVAVVVADSEAEAAAAAMCVRVRYERLAVVNSPTEAMAEGAPLVHEDLASYTITQPPCAPEAGTNVADRAKVRKGDMAVGEAAAAVWVESQATAPQTDHAAMETRSAQVEILPDNRVFVSASTQAPFEVQRILAHLLGPEEGQVVVEVPFVGGAL